MFLNYLKIAFRNLGKHRAFTAINVLGLSVGMAACFLIYVYVQDELSYDRFHENADRIVRVVRERQQSEYEWRGHALTPWRLADFLKAEFPEVQEVVRITQQEMLVRTERFERKEPLFFLADSSFFTMFSYPLESGEAATVLKKPFSVVLTRSAAERYFGDENPIGRVISVDRKHDFTVTGIAEDVPAPSHLHFDFVASLGSIEQMWAGNDYVFEHWGAIWLYTYALLGDPADVLTLRQRMPAAIDARLPTPNASASFRLPVQRLTDIHLRSHYEGEIEANGDVNRLYVLGLIGAIILALACVNFMNLATARSSWRAKEVGVRKVVGARRGNLIRQFLGEAFLIGFGSVFVALMLVRLVLPVFNSLTDKAYTFDVLWDWRIIGGLLVITVIASAAAGSYPAFYLSSFRPIQVLRQQATGRSGALLRRTLVVFQFAATIVLLIGTAVVLRQLGFIQDKALGFDDENVVAVSLNHEDAQANYDRFKQAFQRSPSVLQVAAASNNPPDKLNTWGIDWDGKPQELDISVRVMVVDHDFFETMGISLTAGRTFAAGKAEDEASSFIVNEAAVRQFGFEDPVGMPLRFPVGDEMYKQGTIIGVVQDFHAGSLHEEIHPLVLAVDASWFDRLLVRMEPGNVREGLVGLEREWKRLAPDWPFEYAFLDERIGAVYASERRLSRIFGLFAGLAVFIACLGLLGLAIFTAERRRKEIGVRKVMGASVPAIVLLLSREFAQLVAVGFIVAVPVAYVLMSRWLDDFAYRISLGAELFVFAGVLALGTALAAVAIQTIRAARRDPVESLRYE